MPYRDALSPALEGSSPALSGPQRQQQQDHVRCSPAEGGGRIRPGSSSLPESQPADEACVFTLCGSASGVSRMAAPGLGGTQHPASLPPLHSR